MSRTDLLPGHKEITGVYLYQDNVWISLRVIMSTLLQFCYNTMQEYHFAHVVKVEIFSRNLILLLYLIMTLISAN